jgi:hypothetical protein
MAWMVSLAGADAGIGIAPVYFVEEADGVAPFVE